MDGTSIMLIGFITLVILIGITVFFLLTLQNTLKAVSPIYRRMQPAAVWRTLIPFYNFYFIFIMVEAIADSIEAHLQQVGLEVKKPTYQLGRAWAILSLVNFLLNALKIEVLSSITSIVLLGCFIAYWASVASYKKKVEQTPELILDVEKEQANAVQK